MASMEEEADLFRVRYPWGRKSPRTRIDELRKKRTQIEIDRRVLTNRYNERLVEFERELQANDANLAIAEACERDRLKRLAVRIGEELLKRGTDVTELIETSQIDDGFIRRLEELRAGGVAPDEGLSPGVTRTFREELVVQTEIEDLITSER